MRKTRRCRSTRNPACVTCAASRLEDAPRRRLVVRGVAVAHSLLVAVYHVLRDDVPFRDLGPDHFHRVRHDHLLAYHPRRLTDLGYQVTLEIPKG